MDLETAAAILRERLRNASDINRQDLRVTVENDTVALVGSLPDERQCERVRELAARAIPGVRLCTDLKSREGLKGEMLAEVSHGKLGVNF